MAKIQTIRRRIRSVKNIRQITKAMEMVAASKLRRAQEAALRSRLYANAAREALVQLGVVNEVATHPLFARRPITHRLMIVISSDRGLAGAYNANLLKTIVQELRSGIPTKFIVIGSKGAQFITRLTGNSEVVGVYTNWPRQPTMAHISPIIGLASQLFADKKIDEVTVVFTDFISTIRQQVVARTLLPLDPAAVLGPELRNIALRPDILIEPGHEELLAYILPRFFEVQVYQAFLEAAASEESMRMVAMKSASDNAKDLIGDLTLTFNGARQAAITQELAEISAGTQAVS
jgi:F-type H+-transporting ATPase subunit gamma